MKTLKCRKLLAMALALVMILSLAACGSSDSSTSTSSSDTSASSESSDSSESTESEESTESTETIKIGVLLSTTGDFSISETPMVNAAKMAIDEINEAGGINGAQIEAIYMDYGSDPSMAAEKATELILQDEVVAIVGTNSSSTRLAVLPIVEEYDSLLVYNTFYEGETPSDNCLYTNTVPSQQVDAFIPYILENIGTNVYFVGSDYEFPRNTIEYAKELVESLGGTVVGEEYAPSGTTDFSSIVNKIKATDADVVFSAVAGNDSVYFYTDYSQYGMDIQTTPICSVAAHEGTVKGIGDVAVGAYSCFSYFNTLGTEESDEFVAKYEELFGTDTTVNNGAEATYHGIYILAEALKNAESYSAEDIIAAAAGVEVDAPSGTIKMDETNHHAWLNVYIGKVNEDLTFDIVYQSDGLVEPQVG